MSDPVVEILQAQILEVVSASPEVVEILTGRPGLSAYEVAVANGFVGTEVEWLASLVGASAIPTGGEGEVVFIEGGAYASSPLLKYTRATGKLRLSNADDDWFNEFDSYSGYLNGTDSGIEYQLNMAANLMQFYQRSTLNASIQQGFEFTQQHLRFFKTDQVNGNNYWQTDLTMPEPPAGYTPIVLPLPENGPNEGDVLKFLGGKVVWVAP